MVGADMLKKLRWKVHPTANGELVLLTGVSKVDFTEGGRSVESEIFFSLDLAGMIVGLD